VRSPLHGRPGLLRQQFDHQLRQAFCGFARADSVDRAVFAASPLVTRPTTWSAGIAVSWVFARSSLRVRVPD
jgi:hypothetical protein